MKNTYTASAVMDELLRSSTDISSPLPGELVEGTVVSITKNKILVDLDGIATGMISGQEACDSLDTLKSLKVGDSISAYVLEEENEDGLVVLSLRKASQEKTWKRFVDSYQSQKSIQVIPNEANKGGLLLNIDGIKGFIPVSQLAPLHYPRVDGADSNVILARLQKLIGLTLSVRIINLDREGGKLILSEKAAEEEVREGSLNKLEVGQTVKGKISGIVKFGIFVTFDGLEGLVHISEIAWGHVKDPHDYGRLGDPVDIMVIGKDKDKISLSIKRLTPDPWVSATKKYQIGTLVEGEITRITPFGAFMRLENDINGLIHVSEISNEENADPSQSIKVGDKIKAKVIAIDPEDHRVGLSIKALSEKPEKKAKKTLKDEDITDGAKEEKKKKTKKDEL
ncbi:S1 RNA-binding domain-containing protein [Candidatus Peregrinibacteria bacterium]|nr:S1 RNA-binding domain-containing protein [Candidatus Peregrinibacteria bacterium]